MPMRSPSLSSSSLRGMPWTTTSFREVQRTAGYGGGRGRGGAGDPRRPPAQRRADDPPGGAHLCDLVAALEDDAHPVILPPAADQGSANANRALPREPP